MRVTIVTPSYNQAPFLEQTIESVFNQTYHDVEYILIDGASTDGSRGIIDRYRTRFAYSQSTKDLGFADAVNQGWKRSSGQILSYLNSDDVLEKDAVRAIVESFEKHPATAVIYGDTTMIDAAGNFLDRAMSEPFDIKKVFTTWNDPIRQPSAFLRKEVLDRFGGLDETLQFCADFEFWIRISPGVKFLHIPGAFSRSRLHSDAKSVCQQDIQAQELLRLFEKFKDTDTFLSSGVAEAESRAAVHRKATELYIQAGKKRDALRTHLRYTSHLDSALERFYRNGRFIARLLFRT